MSVWFLNIYSWKIPTEVIVVVCFGTIKNRDWNLCFLKKKTKQKTLISILLNQAQEDLWAEMSDIDLGMSSGFCD